MNRQGSRTPTIIRSNRVFTGYVVALLLLAPAAAVVAQRPQEGQEKAAAKTLTNKEKQIVFALQQERERLQQENARLEQDLEKLRALVKRVNAAGIPESVQTEKEGSLPRALPQSEVPPSQRAQPEKPLPRQQGPEAVAQEDSRLSLFTLKHIKTSVAAEAINTIYGGGPAGMGGVPNMRFAVDEFLNTLIVRADEKTMRSVAELLKTLDVPAANASRDHSEKRHALQLRVVWLLDGLPEGQGKPPTARVVSRHVVAALKELGFEDPKVVSQQMTTLTVQEQIGGQLPRFREQPNIPGVTLTVEELHGGQFHFAAPVLIHEKVWQLRGMGLVTNGTDDRFNMEFNLQVQQAGGSGDGHLPGETSSVHVQQGHVSGSIQTPLRHYTVMGTTIFVGSEQPPRQYPSAFVVYLDHAQEFPRGPE